MKSGQTCSRGHWEEDRVSAVTVRKGAADMAGMRIQGGMIESTVWRDLVKKETGKAVDLRLTLSTLRLP